MANLNSMPVEIIDNICLQLPTVSARKAVASLCRTSRRLHQIVLPRLYSHIYITAEEALLVPFTRSLHKNQHLADLVRHVTLEQYPELERDQILESHFASQQPDFLAGERVETDGKTTGSAEWYAIRTLELLFSRLRNLEYLLLEVHGGCYRDDCFTYIRDKHLDNTEFMRHLKEVIVCNRYGFKFGSITALLSNTPVQEMCLENCVDIRELDNFCLPSLLELKLTEMKLDTSEVIRLLKFFPNLRSFFYKKPFDYEWGRNDNAFTTTTGMGKALRHLKKRLQTLSLNFVVEHLYALEASMPSFVEFSKLQTLTIEMYALADRVLDDDSDSVSEDEYEVKASLNEIERDSDCKVGNYIHEFWVEKEEDDTVDFKPWSHKLPRSLQYLHITDTRMFSRAGITDIANKAKDDLPSLRTLVVDSCLGLKALFQNTQIEYIEPCYPRYRQCIMDEEWQ